MSGAIDKNRPLITYSQIYLFCFLACYLFHPDNLRGSLLTVATVGDCDDSLCQIDESQSCHRFRIKSCWLSAVTTLADTLHDGNLCQQRHIHLLGQMLGTVFPENIILVLGQFCRCEPRHILNQTEYGHIHLLVAIHVDAFAGVGKSHALRCTHDDGTGDGKRL